MNYLVLNILEELFYCKLRFGDDFDGSGFQSCDGAPGKFTGNRGTDDDGSIVSFFNFSNKSYAIHAWHFYIQSDHIRPVFLHLFLCKNRVLR